VLRLHTSGTSGNKKLVPYSLEMLVVGVACIASSCIAGGKLPDQTEGSAGSDSQLYRL